MNPNQIIITLLPTGQVEVTGPLENKIWCYGLLKAAEKEIDKYEPGNIIVIPATNGGLITNG